MSTLSAMQAILSGGFLPGKEEEQVKTIELKKDELTFQCGICYIKYKDDLLGAETAREGKICRFCLDKKQRELK
ncbi:14421_t:CDS:2 [Entrophospora sp. SA101]|nr:14421_t:CDS:2 [Entrophospora sp. SA101]CAJ0841070.1 22222_t:CDS:2 [Entrophospora sp. SA101]